MSRPPGMGSKWIRRSTRFAIYDRDGFTCVFCGVNAAAGVELTLDHLTAAAAGGQNHPTNLVTACFPCNSAKQHMTIRAWYRYLRRLGQDTRKIGRRVRRQAQKPIDRARGRALAESDAPRIQRRRRRP